MGTLKLAGIAHARCSRLLSFACIQVVGVYTKKLCIPLPGVAGQSGSDVCMMSQRE